MLLEEKDVSLLKKKKKIDVRKLEADPGCTLFLLFFNLHLISSCFFYYYSSKQTSLCVFYAMQ